MPTLEELETTLGDVRRATSLLDDLQAKRQELLGELAAIDAQMATAKASASANEAALRQLVPGFTLTAKR